MHISLEDMLAGVRAENRGRYKAARTLWMFGADGSVADILTNMLVAEAKVCVLEGFAHELAAKKGLDPVAALECALILYGKECEPHDPKKEFGVHATIYYP